MFTRRSALAAAAISPLAAQALAQTAAPKPPSIEELVRDPVVYDAAISPNGEQLAVLRTQMIAGKREAFVTLSQMAALEQRPAIVRIGDRQVDQVEWANNERLLIWVTFPKDEKGNPHGLWYGDTFLLIPVRRVISVDLKGENPVVLFDNAKAIMKRGFNAATIVDFMKADPRLVLMQAWNENRDAYALYHVDVYTGDAQLVEQGVSATDGWLTQNGVPMLRFDSNSRRTTGWVYGRAPGEKDWKLVRKSRFNEVKKLPDFDVVGATQKAGVFLVSQRMDGKDGKVVRNFDIATLSFGDVVAEAPHRDIEEAFVDENLGLVGAAYWDDRLNYQFTDPQLAAHFRACNVALKNSCNLRLYDIDESHNRLLLKASGPQESGAFYVYDRSTKHLEFIGIQRPWLPPERLAPMEALRVKTRDGAEITAYLTTPIGPAARPRPMVVLPHGGPERRDFQDFDLFVQTLAAQGWMVLQVNFRGSSGYGKAFADLGRKEWGQRMQEDVEDAVAQVLAAGRADRSRLAIMGASYGGYAALMGGVRNPDLYKAVVSIAGDADLIESLAFSRREDGADSPAYAYWRASMGDPKTDEAMLIRASPARRAGEIKAPVLLIHGTEDTIVDPKQSKIMAKALAAAGKRCDVVELKGEGHRDWSRETMTKVLTRATEFIAKALA